LAFEAKIKYPFLPIFYGPIKMFAVHVLTLLKREINREIFIFRTKRESEVQPMQKEVNKCKMGMKKMYRGGC